MLAQPLSDERRFVNNPFARALHPVPSRSRLVRVALAIVSLLAAMIMGVALLAPLVVLPGLLLGRAHQGRWGMVLPGLLIAALYLLLAVAGLRRLWARRRGA